MKNEIRELYSKGKTLNEISSRLNVSIGRVKYYIYSLGFRPEVMPVKKLTLEKQNRIRQLMVVGDYTMHEIADEVGLKSKDISEFVREW